MYRVIRAGELERSGGGTVKFEGGPYGPGAPHKFKNDQRLPVTLG